MLPGLMPRTLLLVHPPLLLPGPVFLLLSHVAMLMLTLKPMPWWQSVKLSRVSSWFCLSGSSSQDSS